MNNFRLTPIAGLLTASVLLAACGGSDSSDNNAANTNSGATNTGGSTTTTSTETNSVAQVKQAMTGTHEATSAELPTALVAGPVVSTATAPATATALGGYGQVFTAADNTATNTRVHLSLIHI